MSGNLLFSIMLYLAGHICVWYQINSQFVWDYWKDKALISAMIYAVPASLFFWYATKLAYAEFAGLWGPRFLAFSVSWLVFPILTWYYLGESMFTYKTMTCVFLSILIVCIQVFWK